MAKVRIDVETRRWVTQEADPDDSWDRDNTAQEITHVTATLDREDGYMYGSFETELSVEPGDYVYAVIVEYSTGDTFGNDSGQYSILDAFDTEEAAGSLKDAIQDQARENRFGKRIVEYTLDHKGKTYYCDWFGYFEQFEQVRVHELVVRS